MMVLNDGGVAEVMAANQSSPALVREVKRQNHARYLCLIFKAIIDAVLRIGTEGAHANSTRF